MIGNSTNGLKRTTVGAIGNLFSVSGLFNYWRIDARTNPTSTTPSFVPIEAPDIPGYTFAFWLAPASDHAYYSHVDNPVSKKTGVWTSIPNGDTTPRAFHIYAMYVNSKIA
ncbi:hypothetical protein [Lactococcus lactis]|uniref:hypothetical protein n=1 Tax=Lactococcus lactis TaxID=1358 RepID=UPI002899415A|nr:hypothetical protein [Lactococcus lactis]